MPVTEPINKTMAPCSQCLRQTTHHILHLVEKKHYHDEEDNGEDVEVHQLIECAGCGAISMAHRWFGHESPNGPPKPEDEYYPSPVSRRKPSPSWALRLALWPEQRDKTNLFLLELFDEIYQAVNAGQHRLATMGIRSLLETIMIAKVGDPALALSRRILARAREGRGADDGAGGAARARRWCATAPRFNNCVDRRLCTPQSKF
jgi:hypothetical protein